MITAGALFVLAAPAAQANLERMNSPKASITKHRKISPAHGTTVRVHKVHKKTTDPIYIHFPGTSAPSSSTTSSDDCANYMVDCTDEQLCSFWGTSCGSILAPSTTDATPVEPAQVASPQSEAPATEAPPVSTSGSDNRSASDQLLCPGGGLWDEDHEYCV